jgi:hypothetical protein
MNLRPFAAENMQAYADPANYWGMAPGGLLHYRQAAFLSSVLRDPEALGFEGSPREVDRLRVAAVYTQEVQGEQMLSLAARSFDEPYTHATLAPHVITPHEDRIVRDAEETLAQHSDTQPIMAALRRRHAAEDQTEPFNPLSAASAWQLSANLRVPAEAAAYRTIARTLTRYENRLYQPVISRLRNRMSHITAEQAALEIQGGLLDADRNMDLYNDDYVISLDLALLGAAQRTFRRTGATALSTELLSAHMGLTTEDGSIDRIAIHRLACLGAIKRNAAGNHVTATELLRVPQSKVGHIASRVGERLLHVTGLRRIPKVVTA